MNCRTLLRIDPEPRGKPSSDSWRRPYQCHKFGQFQFKITKLWGMKNCDKRNLIKDFDEGRRHLNIEISKCFCTFRHMVLSHSYKHHTIVDQEGIFVIYAHIVHHCAPHNVPSRLLCTCTERWRRGRCRQTVAQTPERFWKWWISKTHGQFKVI